MTAQMLIFPGVRRDRGEDFRRGQQTPPPRIEHSGKRLEVVWPPPKKKPRVQRDWLVLPETLAESR